MNGHRIRQARETAAALVVIVYPMPGPLRWRATAVVPTETVHAYTRVTAAGFTRAHAQARARRQVVRELLRGWW